MFEMIRAQQPCKIVWHSTTEMKFYETFRMETIKFKWLINCQDKQKFA